MLLIFKFDAYMQIDCVWYNNSVTICGPILLQTESSTHKWFRTGILARAKVAIIFYGLFCFWKQHFLTYIASMCVSVWFYAATRNKETNSTTDNK